jgi:hypothetical protein
MSQSETPSVILTRFARRWTGSISIDSFNPTRLSDARSMRSYVPGHGQEQMSHAMQGAGCHPAR